jgi:EcsC protein family
MASTYSLAAQPLVGSIVDAIEDLVARVPPSRERTTDAPAAAARVIARKSATRAAALSGALALPPGVFGLLTVLPDLIAIWRIQAQMVSDLAGLYGKEMQLTRTHMLYCLFRHASSQLARDVVVRAGQRFVVTQLSGGALRSVLTSIGISISQRVAGTTASRWVPVLGAVAVAGYAYFDTLQVAKTAIRLLEGTTEDVTPAASTAPAQSPT